MPLPELPELEELYRLYRADLYRYLCHLTHDPAEAEDLLSETFLRALKRLHTYRGDCAVKTWLFGIARNIWLEGLRKKHPTASTDDLLEGCLAEDTLTERTDSRLQWQRVKELLQQRDDRAHETKANLVCRLLLEKKKKKKKTKKKKKKKTKKNEQHT